MWEIIRNADIFVIEHLNYYSGYSQYFDYMIWRVANNDFIKGGILVGALWAVWILQRQHRDLISDMVRAIFGIVGAIFAGRALQVFLPHRDRPIYDTNLDFRPPDHALPMAVEDWSSLPSDHAVLYTAIAVAILFRSHAGGIFAIVWTVAIILFPRAYVGLHFPSDLIAGAVLGAAIMVLAMTAPLPAGFLDRVRDLKRRFPAQFQMLLFLVAFESASQFRGSRFFIGSINYYIGIL